MSSVQALESWQLDPISFEPKLDYDNYSIWSFKIEIILKSRGLWRLVDGTEEVAPGGLERWEMRDASSRDGEGDMDRAAGAFPTRVPVQEVAHHAQVHLGKARRRGDVASHVQRMGELWQDVLACKAYTSRDADAFFVTTLLDSLPPSWSVFVAAWKVMPDPSKVSCSTVVGHILDLDAWNRGRADAHSGQVVGTAHRRGAKSKMIDD
ncbi:hypothetical protein BJV74DRAFT_889792 [Russula compacta]|nr:hypothetical protein BJV74DRAFT_889792 [Russula compacta]